MVFDHFQRFFFEYSLITASITRAAEAGMGAGRLHRVHAWVMSTVTISWKQNNHCFLRTFNLS